MLWALTAAVAIAAPQDDLCTALLDEDLALAEVDARVEAALDAGAEPYFGCAVEVDNVVLGTREGAVLGAIFPPLIPFLGAAETTETRRIAPLKLALVRDAWRTLELLVEAGASPTVRFLPHPLAGDPERLREARAAGLDLSRVRRLGSSDALRTDPAVAEAFLDAGLPPATLLHAAVKAGSTEVSLLALAGLDPAGIAARRAMEATVLDERWDLLEALHAAGVPLDPRSRRPGSGSVAAYVSLLCTAAGVDGGVERLLALGADPDPPGRGDDWGPMACASRKGDADEVQALLDAGAAPLPAAEAADASRQSRRTEPPSPPPPLCAPVIAGDVDAVRGLLDAGADPSARCRGVLPIEQTDDPALQDLLVAAGSPLPQHLWSAWWQADQRDRVAAALRDRRPTWILEQWLGDAIRGRDAETVRWLLDRGADPTGTRLRSPLQGAMNAGCRGCALALLDAGAQASDPRWHFHDPLSQALDLGWLDLVGPLIEAGAELQPSTATFYERPMETALRLGADAVDALLVAGHPVTPGVVRFEASTCETERLVQWWRSTPEVVDRGEALRWARSCDRAVRQTLRRELR